MRGLYCLHELFFYLLVGNMKYDKPLKRLIGFSVQMRDNNLSQYVNKNTTNFSKTKNSKLSVKNTLQLPFIIYSDNQISLMCPQN